MQETSTRQWFRPAWLGTIALLYLVGLLHLRPLSAQEAAPKSISFNRDIRPILSDKCFQCHGPDPDARESDLRFDNPDSALQAITPGKVESSELVRRIGSADPDEIMPPPSAHKALTPEEIQRLTEWVRQGAVWDEFWAYQTPRSYPVTPPVDTSWSNQWIDQMVLSRLEEHGLTPAPPADPTTLVRRLYLDLIGLPPTPDQVEQFRTDPSPAAYEQLVDHLLASRHFGERLAIYWLDLVRFSDTVGYHGDQDHNISPYRDWVIHAFNSNLPFDEFTRAQLAGDLLPDATESQRIATGYNRLLQTTHEGGLQPMEYRAIYAADRVRNLSAVWMGATVGCAQCHDHKYDPYTARDFYSLAAFFADIDDERHFKDGTNALPTRRLPEWLVISDADRAQLNQVELEIGKLQEQHNALKGRHAELSKLKPPGAGEANGDANGETGQEAGEAAQPDGELAKLEALIEASSAQLKQENDRKNRIQSRGAWTMITEALPQPRPVRILPRGNWLDESGAEVMPAIPGFLGTLETTAPRLTRLDLANWLTDCQTGSGKLTARVFVNRLWYLYLGVGISRSLDDFGGQGEPPAYPELLDNLALDFARDWDIKRAIRQIVLSQTYQQSSVASEERLRRDPYNQMFARQSRFRLPAEIIRDVTLATSGLLNLAKVGGHSVKPYQPAGYYRHLNFPPRKYSHSTNEDQWRRGVYVHWQRMFLHPTLKALDAPSREECTCQRPRSNTPLAALALLNDPSMVEAARVFAQRILNESASRQFSDRLEFAFRWTLSRSPTTRETEILEALYQADLADFRGDLAAARLALSTGQAPLADQLEPAELAAWTSVARALFNLSETTTRN